MKKQNEPAKENAIEQFTQEEASRIGEAIVANARENPREFGTQLVDIVKQRSNKVFMERVVNRVQELVEHRDSLLRAKDGIEREISLCDKRILAVQEGKFTMSSDGRILYNDVLLQY
jgi:hypothetical protein